MKSIAIDLDGTLAQYDGWKGIQHIGKPIPGAQEFVAALAKKFRIIIHTCRTNVELNGPEVRKEHPDFIRQDIANYLKYLVEEWLKQHEFQYNEVWNGIGKPVAEWYIDGKALRFKQDNKMQGYRVIAQKIMNHE